MEAHQHRMEPVRELSVLWLFPYLHLWGAARQDVSHSTLNVVPGIRIPLRLVCNQLVQSTYPGAGRNGHRTTKRGR